MPRTSRTLQMLRAAACLMVVTYHALDATRPSGAPSAWPNGAAGVDLFFVISGFVMAQSGQRLGVPEGWWIFLWRRAARIVPLYWGLTSLKLAITLAHPALTPATAPGPWNIAASYLFIPARDGLGVVRPVLGVGWTLQYEMLFYAVFACGLARGRPSLAFLLGCLAPLALLGFIRGPDWPAVLVLANPMVLEFCAGVALAGLPPMGSRTALWLVLTGTALLVSAPSGGVWRFACWGLPASALVAGAASLDRLVPAWRITAFLVRAGDASYATYLLHPFIVPALAHGLPWWPCAVLASLVGGQALHDWIEAPVQRFLKKKESSFLKKRSKKLLRLGTLL